MRSFLPLLIRRNAAFLLLLAIVLLLSYSNSRFLFHQDGDFPFDPPTTSPPSPTTESLTNKSLPALLYRPDGLLQANNQSRHPIYDLTQSARLSWERKLARQSKSLRAACLEYKRRYQRNPPPGFDKWWEYVERHNVQLPDEYDFLHRNLEIFWGVDPSLLEQRRRDWATQPGTFTLGKADLPAPVQVTSKTSQRNGDIANVEWRAGLQLDAVKEIGHLLPPFNATFYSEDVPYQFFSYEAKDYARKAARSKSIIQEIPNPPYLGWASACAPNSSLHAHNNWNVHPTVEDLHGQRPKTFIYDQLSSMDPCEHWQLVHIVGYLSNHGKGPGASTAILPSFAISSDLLHSDILAVSPEGWTEQVGHDPVWDRKRDARLYWRGSNTGAYYAEKNPWAISHRARLMSQSNSDETVYEVLASLPDSVPVGEPKRVPGWKLNRRLLDVSFTGEPLQCDDKICSQLRSKFDFGGLVPPYHGNQYKYLLDIDGNAWSARFKRLMSTNSCVLKSTMFPEWYVDRIQPWLHFVPVKVDLSDLYDILIFFRGEEDSTHGNDALGASIAKAGKDWSLSFYRKEDMTAYMFRLYLEYARLMNPERDTLSFSDF